MIEATIPKLKLTSTFELLLSCRILSFFSKSTLISDIDNNGYLDAHDFECLAVRACVLEGKGDCSSARLAKYQHIMISLWEEIAQLADFDKVPPDYVGFPFFILLFVRVASYGSTLLIPVCGSNLVQSIIELVKQFVNDFDT